MDSIDYTSNLSELRDLVIRDDSTEYRAQANERRAARELDQKREAFSLWALT